MASRKIPINTYWKVQRNNNALTPGYWQITVVLILSEQKNKQNKQNLTKAIRNWVVKGGTVSIPWFLNKSCKSACTYVNQFQLHWKEEAVRQMFGKQYFCILEGIDWIMLVLLPKPSSGIKQWSDFKWELLLGISVPFLPFPFLFSWNVYYVFQIVSRKAGTVSFLKFESRRRSLVTICEPREREEKPRVN